MRTHTTGARLDPNPALPHEIRSTTRLGTRQGDRRADREGAPASRGIGRDGRHRHLQSDPLRARQADRRVGVSPLGLGPTSRTRSKNKAARIVDRRTPSCCRPVAGLLMSAVALPDGVADRYINLQTAVFGMNRADGAACCGPRYRKDLINAVYRERKGRTFLINVALLADCSCGCLPSSRRTLANVFRKSVSALLV